MTAEKDLGKDQRECGRNIGAELKDSVAGLSCRLKQKRQTVITKRSICQVYQTQEPNSQNILITKRFDEITKEITGWGTGRAWFIGRE